MQGGNHYIARLLPLDSIKKIDTLEKFPNLYFLNYKNLTTLILVKY